VRYAAVRDAVDAARLLGPMREVAEPLIDAGTVLPYAAIGAVPADPPNPMPVHEEHPLLRELTPEAVEALLAVAGPESGSAQTIVELRMLGGALARPARHRSAFCHRGAAFALTIIGVLVPRMAEMGPHTGPSGRCGGSMVHRSSAAELCRGRPLRRGWPAATTRTRCTGWPPWPRGATPPGFFASGRWPGTRCSAPSPASVH
jgi:hypothetical protein